MTIQQEGLQFRNAVQVFLSSNFGLKEAEVAFDAALINAALTANRGNVSATARQLRIHRNTLSRRVARLRATDRLEAVLRPRWQSRKPERGQRVLRRIVGGSAA